MGPWEKPLKAYRPRKFENLPENWLFAFLGPKWVKKKLGFRPWDPHGEIRAGILRISALEMSKTVGWRPIW